MTDRWTWHGGGLKAARARYDKDSAWIDLSTGINPHGWPVPEQRFDWASLPEEADVRALEAAAAAYFGTDPVHVCALPGTEIGLRLIDGLIDGPAFHCIPAYRTHGEMLGGSLPVSFDRIAQADGATLILANPNNPDGRSLDHAVLHDLLARRGKQGWLIVDEAFVDTLPQLSVAATIGENCRLLIFRSFGKFFGLAGVRLGFLLGPPSFLARVRHRLGAWPLSAATIAIGMDAYRDRHWIDTVRNRLLRESAALDRMLTSIGHQPTGDCPLFRLINVTDAHGLFDILARRAILTRPFADNPHWLRIGLPPDAAALDRLVMALRHG